MLTITTQDILPQSDTHHVLHGNVTNFYKQFSIKDWLSNSQLREFSFYNTTLTQPTQGGFMVILILVTPSYH